MINRTTSEERHINLRVMREKRGWTKTKTADELGFSRTYYSDVENGNHGISLNMMHAIMKKFNVEYEDFYNKTS